MNQLAVEALKATSKALAISPKTFDMCDWVQRREAEGDCTTTLCIAGHMLVYAGWKPSFFEAGLPVRFFINPMGYGLSVGSAMLEVFEIDVCNPEQGSLFYEDEWDPDLKPSVDKRTQVHRAQQMIERYLDRYAPPQQPTNTETAEPSLVGGR